MVKSQVEGSTTALVRLEEKVQFSNYIRPICLTDTIDQNKVITSSTTAPNHSQARDGKRSGSRPHTAQLVKRTKDQTQKWMENRQYFNAPLSAYTENSPTGYSAEFLDGERRNPKAEALSQYQQSYPDGFYETKQTPPTHSNNLLQYNKQQTVTTSTTPIWTNCNTLGWSRQRDHLQRVQLKIGDMAACENVSIATVNSICTETAYHKQDCSEEEFAGSSVMCLLPDGKQWALVGVSSWRIACAQTGIERPRMYDKITSNNAWIRETINSA